MLDILATICLSFWIFAGSYIVYAVIRDDMREQRARKKR